MLAKRRKSPPPPKQTKNNTTANNILLSGRLSLKSNNFCDYNNKQFVTTVTVWTQILLKIPKLLNLKVFLPYTQVQNKACGIVSTLTSELKTDF